MTAGAEFAFALAEAGAAFTFVVEAAGALWLALWFVVSDVPQAIEKKTADEISKAVLKTLINSLLSVKFGLLLVSSTHAKLFGYD
jgi:hypothetical protein